MSEKDADKFARMMAERYGMSWGKLTPEHRDRCRKQCSEMLTYMDSTAFPEFFKAVSDV